MRIKLLRGVVINGKAHRPNDVVDASVKDANSLLTANKATIAHDDNVEVVETFDKPARGRKKKGA